MKIKSIFATFGKPNVNGHNWPIEIMKKAIEEYKNRVILKNKAIGYIFEGKDPHISDTERNLNNASFLINDIKLNEDNTSYEIDINILESLEMGKLLKSLLDSGIKFSPNMKIESSLDENKILKEPVKIISIDLLYGEAK